MEQKKLHWLLLLSLVAGFVLSRYGAKGGLDWWLQVSPVIVTLIVLLVTYSKFRLTPMSYILIWVYAIILLIGAHYNYSDPFFNWLQKVLQLKRNNFDRLCHFLQGFVPAIIVREFLLRRTRLLPGKKIFFIAISIPMAASALFEVFEWWGAVLTGRSSSSFLGTQGDVWDTQKDMFICFIGSIISLLLLTRMHNRQLAQLGVDKVKKYI